MKHVSDLTISYTKIGDYREPSVSVEYKLQLILFHIPKMCRNRFQYSFGIRV